MRSRAAEPERRRVPGVVERLLDGDREPVERAAHLAAAALLVGAARGGERLVAEHDR